MFGLFKKKQKPGCLDGKTELQKSAFFAALSTFASDDPGFFEQQYLDLKPHERKQFSDWLTADTEQKKKLKAMLAIIEELLKEKYNK